MSDGRPVPDGSGEPAAAGAAEAAGGAEAAGVAEAAAAAGAEPTPDGEVTAGAEPTHPLVIKRRGRRVSTEPSPGYTGEPARERTQSTENDARIWGDLPPHWGKR